MNKTTELPRAPKAERASKAPKRTSSSRDKMNTQSSPPLVSGHKKGKRGQARSTRSRA